VLQRAAYQSCSCLQAPDGQVFDYSDDRDQHGHVVTLMLGPSGSPEWVSDVETCWTRASQAERYVNAQEARTLEISLPHTLPRELWEPCTRMLVDRFLAAGMVVQADIHAPRTRGGLINLHVHCCMSLRRIEGDGFAKRKAREWNRLFYRNPQKLRAEIAASLTAFCAQHGIDYEADARNNCEQGLPAPEFTVPSWNIHAARRTGRPTEWLRARDEFRDTKRRLADLQDEMAILDHEILLEEMEQLTRTAPVARLLFYVEEMAEVTPEPRPPGRHGWSARGRAPDAGLDDAPEMAAPGTFDSEDPGAPMQP
jgi:hypothetical protein